MSAITLFEELQELSLESKDSKVGDGAIIYIVSKLGILKDDNDDYFIKMAVVANVLNAVPETFHKKIGRYVGDFGPKQKKNIEDINKRYDVNINAEDVINIVIFAFEYETERKKHLEEIVRHREFYESAVL